MKLLKLKRSEGAAGGLYVRCVKCGETKAWNDAVAAGWSADLAGKPYSDYVCGKCGQGEEVAELPSGPTV